MPTPHRCAGMSVCFCFATVTAKIVLNSSDMIYKMNKLGLPTALLSIMSIHYCPR